MFDFRYYINLLNEAAHDQGINNKLNKLLSKNPDNQEAIQQLFDKGKNILKNKQDRMIWFIKILEQQHQNPDSIDQILTDLTHYLGQNIQVIDNYKFDTNNTWEKIKNDLNTLETQYLEKQRTAQDRNKGIIPQEGDYVLFQFNDGTNWWFVDRAYCKEEGRSGEHCGNVVGQHKTDQRILSLRNKNNQVIMTFILEPDGTLGEMKAKYNKKPDEKFHPHIMTLLLWDQVSGISGMGYLPDQNFSIFDLSEENLLSLQKSNPEKCDKFITDQIKITPMEFLRSPDFIRNDEKYKNKVLDIKPALTYILEDSKNVNHWIDAVVNNISLAIYVPPELWDKFPNYKNHLIDALVYDNELILKSSKIISRDTELMKMVVTKEPYAIKYIVPTIKGYKDICKIAVNKNSSVFHQIPTDQMDAELCKIAVSKDGYSIQYVPEELKTPELCKIAVSIDGYSLNYIPEELKIKEICKIAVSNDSSMLYSVPTNMIDYDICKLAVSESGDALQDIPEEMVDYNLCELAIKNTSSAIYHVPEKFQDYKLCKPVVDELDINLFRMPEKNVSLVLCKLVIKKDPSSLLYVPQGKFNDKEMYLLRLIAVKYDGKTIRYITPNYINYKICELAVNNEITTLPYIMKNTRIKLTKQEVFNLYKLAYKKSPTSNVIPDEMKQKLKTIVNEELDYIINMTRKLLTY